MDFKRGDVFCFRRSIKMTITKVKLYLRCFASEGPPCLLYTYLWLFLKIFLACRGWNLLGIHWFSFILACWCCLHEGTKSLVFKAIRHGTKVPPLSFLFFLFLYWPPRLIEIWLSKRLGSSGWKNHYLRLHRRLVVIFRLIFLFSGDHVLPIGSLQVSGRGGEIKMLMG